MCGITGFIHYKRDYNQGTLSRIIDQMSDTLSHRGPDDRGRWVDEKRGIAIGHRRLSIIDLSDEGHQPMISQSGRFVCAFNGEIYNHIILRKELEERGQFFRGHSDTEILLASVEEWGFEKAIHRFNGMFAIALWDRKNNTLSLARDRIGIKPIYYGWIDHTFVFASELKPFQKHPDWKTNISPGSLGLFFRYNYIPCPHSIYKNVYKLPPACILTINANSMRERDRFSPFPDCITSLLSPQKYWLAQDIYRHGIQCPFGGSERELLDELEKLLSDSVALRMLSDRPIGAFLSGGIDSSLIVALMQSQSSIPIRTFTMGFEEDSFNEAPYAKSIAEHIGSDHTEMYVTSKDAYEMIPRLPCLYDEPFADSSQIPTYLLSRLTRNNVTVALSGDGGDEVFAGYNRYLFLPSILKKVNWIPWKLRRVLSAGIKNNSRPVYEFMVQWMSKIVPALKTRQASDSINRISDVIGSKNIAMAHDLINSHCQNPEKLVLNYKSLATLEQENSAHECIFFDNWVRLMMYKDIHQCLPDDMLTKVDRASMGVGLEVRVPLLDHRIVELSAQFPVSMLINRSKGKLPLRKILDRYVPEHLFDRPKKGFGIPVGEWLRGPLREWADSLLESSRVKREGYLDAKEISSIWYGHLAGKGNRTSSVWGLLMFQAWLDEIM